MYTRSGKVEEAYTGISCTGLRLLYVSFNEIAFNMQYTIMLTARIPSRVYAIHPQPKSNSFRNPPLATDTLAACVTIERVGIRGCK